MPLRQSRKTRAPAGNRVVKRFQKIVGILVPLAAAVVAFMSAKLGYSASELNVRAAEIKLQSEEAQARNVRQDRDEQRQPGESSRVSIPGPLQQSLRITPTGGPTHLAHSVLPSSSVPGPPASAARLVQAQIASDIYEPPGLPQCDRDLFDRVTKIEPENGSPVKVDVRTEGQAWTPGASYLRTYKREQILEIVFQVSAQQQFPLREFEVLRGGMPMRGLKVCVEPPPPEGTFAKTHRSVLVRAPSGVSWRDVFMRDEDSRWSSRSASGSLTVFGRDGSAQRVGVR